MLALLDPLRGAARLFPPALALGSRCFPPFFSFVVDVGAELGRATFFLLPVGGGLNGNRSGYFMELDKKSAASASSFSSSSDTSGTEYWFVKKGKIGCPELEDPGAMASTGATSESLVLNELGAESNTVSEG